MKYLKFIDVKSIPPMGDYFESDFKYVISDSLTDISDPLNSINKKIKIKISGREDASSRGLYSHWDIDKAFFEIAKEYIIKKIKSGFELMDVEESYGDLFEYVDVENTNLVNFNTSIISIEN